MATPVRVNGLWWGYKTTGGLHARLCRIGTGCFGFSYIEYEEDEWKDATSVFTARTASEALAKAKASRNMFCCRMLTHFKSWMKDEVTEMGDDAPWTEDDMNVIPKKVAKEEKNMFQLEKKVFVDGADGAELSDEQIFTKIAKAEAEITKLEAVQTKPKKLEARITTIRQYIKDLGEYVDNR